MSNSTQNTSNATPVIAEEKKVVGAPAEQNGTAQAPTQRPVAPVANDDEGDELEGATEVAGDDGLASVAKRLEEIEESQAPATPTKPTAAPKRRADWRTALLLLLLPITVGGYGGWYWQRQSGAANLEEVRTELAAAQEKLKGFEADQEEMASKPPANPEEVVRAAMKLGQEGLDAKPVDNKKVSAALASLAALDGDAFQKPEFADAYLLRGRLKKQQKKFKEAIADFKRAQALQAQN